MAEYYPLLAKAVGSIPNSTPESRRVVYERARKALIGQLRTLHPPVPEEDIERESVELDRAVERIEGELANGGLPAPAAPAPPPAEPSPPEAPVPPRPALTPRPPVSNMPPAAKPPFAPLKTKLPKPKAPSVPVESEPTSVPADEPVPSATATAATVDEPAAPDTGPRVRLEPQRPVAPQPPHAAAPKRKLWIIPAGVGGLLAIVAIVGFAAWHFRDKRETVVRAKPAEQAQADSGKIAERVGGAGAPAQTPDTGTSQTQPADAAKSDAQAPAAPRNPELPIASRAALLVEAPEEKSKVKTFLGTVVWKLNNVSEGQNEPVGLAVEADIDMPDARMKAVVIFEKNTDPSLPASHTVKVRFVMQPGNFTGDVKEIDVPQMRPEEVPNGEPLSGATTPVLQNSFLVGLSPGNAETANMKVLQELQWIDIPMRLTNGRIAKLTFEKGEAGQRDLNEAITAWQKG